MKNLKYLILFGSVLYSCEKPKYGTVTFNDYFNYIYYHDFEYNTLGEYRESEWEIDWNYPEWTNRPVPPEILINDDTENGTKVMRWHLPEGSLGPAEGGGQWYTKLDSAYDELYFSYKLKFKPDFKWVLGGKIPGLRGGPEWP